MSWANYAINNDYQLPYWEFGMNSKMRAWFPCRGMVHRRPQYTDSATNGFERIRGALNGAHDGLRDAYADARAAGTTTITPQMLFGATWRHWGLLKKIQSASRGQFQLAIDGVNQGLVQDQYGSGPSWVEVDLGAKTFSTSGSKEFKFTVKGKNASSPAYSLTFDYIKLSPAIAN